MVTDITVITFPKVKSYWKEQCDWLHRNSILKKIDIFKYLIRLFFSMGAKAILLLLISYLHPGTAYIALIECLHPSAISRNNKTTCKAWGKQPAFNILWNKPCYICNPSLTKCVISINMIINNKHVHVLVNTSYIYNNIWFDHWISQLIE